MPSGSGRALTRERCRGPRPAGVEATATEVRGEHWRFQRRLRLGYSRFDDARPGRHQIGSGRRAVGEESHKPHGPTERHGDRLGNQSTIGATPGTSPSLADLLLVPPLNLRPEPKARTTGP